MASEPSPASLADITITWKEENQERRLSGADLALLVTLATTGSQPWADPQEVGLRLRGLGRLIEGFEGEFDDEVRHFTGRTLEDLAARCEWGLSGRNLASSYRVQRKPLRFEGVARRESRRSHRGSGGKTR